MMTDDDDFFDINEELKKKTMIMIEF